MMKRAVQWTTGVDRRPGRKVQNGRPNIFILRMEPKLKNLINNQVTPKLILAL